MGVPDPIWDSPVVRGLGSGVRRREQSTALAGARLVGVSRHDCPGIARLVYTTDGLPEYTPRRKY
jgi:hypothetical protein